MVNVLKDCFDEFTEPKAPDKFRRPRSLQKASGIITRTLYALAFFPAVHSPINWNEAVRACSAGQKAYDQRKWTDAKKEWEAAVASYPSSRLLVYNLATAYSRLGDKSAATTNLNRALQLGFHEFLGDDPELQDLHLASTWPALEGRYRKVEEAFRKKHSDPRQVEIHTDDVHRFWQVWERLQGTDENQWGKVFADAYLDRGTEALKEYYLAKCETPDKFAKAIHHRAAYYDAIRQTTLRVDLDKATIRDSFLRLKDIYFQAMFPDTYFVIGQLTSGGTSLPAGLLIGLEMSSKGPETPLGTLSDWEKGAVGSIDRLPGLIAHELVHYQQKGAGGGTLLEQSMMEGAADFIAGRIAHVIRDRVRDEYAKAHEAELWKRFADQKAGTDFRYWLYGTPPDNGIPPDMGYWIGEKICERYYERSSDKSKALIDIIEMRRPQQIFADSRVAE